MNRIQSPLKVGLVVVVAGAALFGALSFVRKGGFSAKDSMRVHAYFNDASGLSARGAVKIAGIPVGEVTEIRLAGLKADVWMRISRVVRMKVDARISKRSESLLGDFALDLVPGSEGAEDMPDGGEIVNIIDVATADQIFGALSRITSDIQSVTDSLRNVLGGQKGAGSLQRIVENLTRLSETMDRTLGSGGEKLNSILENFENFSQDVRGLSAGQRDTYREIVQNIKLITEDTRSVLATIKGVVGSGEGELKDSVASVKQTLAKLDHSLEALDSVTQKVNEGKGPVARLINDEHLAESVSKALTGASDYVSRMVGIKTEVDVRAERFIHQQASKTYLQLRLLPRPDKYYLLELVDDPHGVTDETVIQKNPTGSTDVPLQTQTVTRNALKFSAQFAKRFSFVTLRMGIIESTGGVGLNLHLIDDALTFKVDAFQLSSVEKRWPRLRAAANYALFNHVYIAGGIDDALNAPGLEAVAGHPVDGRDFFVGAGIYFNDDDLKAILGSIPLPK